MSFRADVLTLFPEAITHYADTSVVGRARERGIWNLHVHDFREATEDVHRTVDDTPFGGGAGMVLKAEPILATLDATPERVGPVWALSPSGRRFTQADADELALGPGVTLICGRYEGFDERIFDEGVDDAVSVGDVVLAGGELAALVVLESVVRLLPGALGNEASFADESFRGGLLEYPHYTKPAIVRGREVPEVLRSGDHGRIARWRRAQSLARTRQRRPDLWAARGGASPEEAQLLAEFGLGEPSGGPSGAH